MKQFFTILIIIFMVIAMTLQFAEYNDKLVIFFLWIALFVAAVKELIND
jgi:hypothetical protein